jgi:hypothetical protein
MNAMNILPLLAPFYVPILHGYLPKVDPSREKRSGDATFYALGLYAVEKMITAR